MTVQTRLPALLPGIPVGDFAAAAPPHALLAPGELLLADVTPGRTVGLTEHLRRWGQAPTPGLPGLVAAAQREGLVGAGGAAFPTARKLHSVAVTRPGPVIVNGSEGESASGKDTVLLDHVPHLVLDGAVMAAQALGSNRVIVRVPATRVKVIATLNAAISERRHAGLRISISPGEDTFIAGEATAVISSLERRPAAPAPLGKPPTMRVGLRRQPVMLSNVETFARLAVAARGFSARSSLLTISGAVVKAGVLEVPVDTALGHILDISGADPDLAAVITGGWHGTWLPASEQVLSTAVNREALREVGGRWGAGAFVAIPRDPCPVDVLRAVTDYLVGEGARQCGPCILGLDAAREDLHAARPVVDRVQGRGLCAHPTATIAAIQSGQALLGGEIALHAAGYCTIGGAR
ncbi:MAG: hypothetical protein R2720_06840 [Candidatus Nanopelagicales bacterium]